MLQKVLARLAAVLLLAPGTARASDAEMVFGAVTVKVGMPQATVIAALRTHFRVEQIAAYPSNWAVRPRSPSDDVDVGTLVFSDGRLSNATKSWGPRVQQEGVAFARGLWGALQSIGDSRVTSCVVTAGQRDQPRSEVRIAKLDCGSRTVTISIIRSDVAEYAMIHEALR